MYELDPFFLTSRREARWILLMWVACFIWTLTVCGLWGYEDSVDPESFPTILGIPRWVAIGIIAPWMVTNVVTFWFCLFYMQDGDLGVEQAEGLADTMDDVEGPAS